MTAATLVLTPATSADAAYLYALIETTMRAYVEAVRGEWTESEAWDVIHRGTGDGTLQIIHADGVRIGTIQVLEHDTHIQLEQFFIAPEHQRHGYGGQLVKTVLERASAAAKPVRLRVLSSNPARAFYERLGFAITETTPARYFMERTPVVQS